MFSGICSTRGEWNRIRRVSKCWLPEPGGRHDLRYRERLAGEVARRTGETKTEAVTQALRERLARLRRGRSKRRLADELEAIAEHCASLPVLDARSPDEILEYDDRGLPR
jgi:antitoxin VapB